GAARISPGRSGQHLAELLADPAGQPARRMAEFLDLGGERAAAALPQAGGRQRRDTTGRGQRQTVPFDRRIALGVALIEQVAVLDEEEAADDQRGNAGEAAVGPLGELRAVELIAVPVENPEPGLVLFRIDRKRSSVHETNEAWRPLRLI